MRKTRQAHCNSRAVVCWYRMLQGNSHRLCDLSGVRTVGYPEAPTPQVGQGNAGLQRFSIITMLQRSDKSYLDSFSQSLTGLVEANAASNNPSALGSSNHLEGCPRKRS